MENKKNEVNGKGLKKNFFWRNYNIYVTFDEVKSETLSTSYLYVVQLQSRVYRVTFITLFFLPNDLNMKVKILSVRYQYRFTSVFQSTSSFIQTNIRPHRQIVKDIFIIQTLKFRYRPSFSVIIDTRSVIDCFLHRVYLYINILQNITILMSKKTNPFVLQKTQHKHFWFRIL